MRFNSHVFLFSLAFGVALATTPALAQLTPATGEIQVSGEIGGPIPGPVVAANAAGARIVLWTGDCGGQGLCFRRYDAAGQPVGGAARLATSTTVFAETPAAAMAAGGDFLVAWSRATGSVTGEIVVRRFAAAGTPLSPERVAGSQVGRLLAAAAVSTLPGGAWAVVWENLRFEGFSGEIALYSGVAIEGRRLTAAAVPEGGVFKVDGPAADLVSNPAVAADGAGRIVVAWERFDFGPDEDEVVARWLDASGTPLGDAQVVHQGSAGIQDSPAVAAAPGGGALVAWENRESGGAGPGVYARAFDLGGPTGPAETRVHGAGPGERSAAAVTVDSAGRYAVAWQRVEQQNGSIFVRPYGIAMSGAAVPLGPQVAVETSGGDHTEPALAADGAGGVLVGWRRRDQQFQRRVLARAFSAPPAPQPCVPDGERLCLGAGGRFGVTVSWRDQRSGDTGVGHAIEGSDRTGYFWFFNQDNVELVTKLLDGRPVNGNYWFFYGALTDVEYTITVVDSQTGARRVYDNAAGNICGRGDTAAFPGGAGSLGGAEWAGEQRLMTIPAGGEDTFAVATRSRIGSISAADGTDCGGDPGDLCLFGDRFRVEVTWRDQRSGDTGVGTAVPFGDKTGFFWFFNSANVELVVKVLDGRSLTGSFWVFYGALTDVEYTLTVTDTVLNNHVEYRNPPGNICGRGDTGALPGS